MRLINDAPFSMSGECSWNEETKKKLPYFENDNDRGERFSPRFSAIPSEMTEPVALMSPQSSFHQLRY
jgi:hypothetical protein